MQLLFTQIQSPKVEHIMEILRRVKSSYYSSFKDVCLKVNEGKSTSLIIILAQELIFSYCYLVSYAHSVILGYTVIILPLML